MKTDMIILIVATIIIVLYFVGPFRCRRDTFRRFGGPAYTSSCEFHPACLQNNARPIGLRNGMEGVCTTNGLACPNFMLDQTSYDTLRGIPWDYNAGNVFMGAYTATYGDDGSSAYQNIKTLSEPIATLGNYDVLENFNLYSSPLPGSLITENEYDDSSADYGMGFLSFA